VDKKAKLSFEVVDVFGDFIPETATATLDSHDLTHKLRADADASKPFTIPGLLGPPNNRYKVQIDVPGYRSVSFFASAEETGEPETRVVFFAVDPKKVVRVEFPDFADIGVEAQSLLNRSDSVLGFPTKVGEDLYTSLDDLRRAGFLNVIAKCRRTRLSNGRTVLSYFEEEISKLQEMRRDRFFAVVPKELREETKNSLDADLFDDASELLHKPPDGFKSAGSFKTPDRAGNLQLSFFGKGDNFVVDVDIDDANGFAHIFQLIQNIGGSTHPYNIHQILVRSQEIDPGYRFLLK
jgi:hypothetical protein